jgi:hydroxyacylglutathione hydrolase
MITIETIETSSLGDRSYLAGDGTVAIVIDPQRDIDRILEPARQRGLQVTHVLETHVHNDYVTGGFELARVTGAAYVLPAGSDVTFDHVPAADGDVLATGELRVRALHTPGHTRHHTSYVLEDAAGTVQAVFTGGSMLYGATGRTDLVGPEHTEELTHAQFHSVRRLAAEVPAEAEVFPTHGFGSFCSATPTSGTSSTIGGQVGVNPALTLAEQDYVDTLLAGLNTFPAYYARMAPINRSGPPPVDLSPPETVEPAELRARIERGEWVVDLRERTAFAAGHLAGTRAFELSGGFVTYLGWLLDWDAPLTLVGHDADQVAQARRELVRIGVDRIAGAAVGKISALSASQPLKSYQVSNFAGLAAARVHRDVSILDTRQNGEWAGSHVAGSQNIPLHELAHRLSEVPEGEVWIHCASGYRASVAASLLEVPGREVVLVDDTYAHAADAGLTLTHDQP